VIYAGFEYAQNHITKSIELTFILWKNHD